MIHERRTCSNCGLVDTLVPVVKDDRDWTWGDGQVYRVQVWRCLACAATDTIRRDLQRRAEKVKAKPGLYAPNDGIRTSVSQVAGPDEDAMAATRAGLAVLEPRGHTTA